MTVYAWAAPTPPRIYDSFAFKRVEVLRGAAGLTWGRLDRRRDQLGLGVTMISVPDALPHLDNGELVRIAPKWYADAGPISLYYASRTLMPAKTRVFVEYVVEQFLQRKLAARFAGSLT